MKKNEFISQLVTFCELEIPDDSLTATTLIKSIDGYDSLVVMSIIAFVDDKMGVNLNAKQIEEISDFNSLIKLIGLEKFEVE
jgi:acyl carrier protein